MTVKQLAAKVEALEKRVDELEKAALSINHYHWSMGTSGMPSSWGGTYTITDTWSGNN